jgi:hypothetical protein
MTDFFSKDPENSRRRALFEEYRQLKEKSEKEGYIDPIDANAMMEEHRLAKECPIDYLISEINSGANPAKEMISELSQSEVFIFHVGGEPLILPTARDGLIVYIFTRASHANRFREEFPAPEIVTITKVSMKQLFMNVFPNQFFSLHVNPSSSSRQFQIQFPQMFVNEIYNLAIHGEEGVKEHRLATGLGIEGRRF